MHQNFMLPKHKTSFWSNKVSVKGKQSKCRSRRSIHLFEKQKEDYLFNQTGNGMNRNGLFNRYFTGQMERDM